MGKTLDGKAALVTGGGTGIGRAIALALAERGASVAVNYSRSREDAERTVGELTRLKAGCLAVRADVSVDDEVRTMVDRTVEELGRLDILVNCAGYTAFVQHRDLEGLTDEIWHRTLDVNLRGTFLCSRAAVPELRKTGRGCIINIAGTAGVTGLGSSIAYCASKAGILSVTRSLAIALAPEIRVNAISPGIIEDTRWTRGQERFNETGRSLTPMGRLAATADVAEAALYLAAGGHFVTGQNIVVDGGRLIHH